MHYYSFCTSTGQEFQCEYMRDVFCITHVHEYFELIFVTEGEISIQTDNADINVSAGNMAIMMPYEVHGFKTINTSKMLVMEFPVEYIPEYKKVFEYAKGTEANNEKLKKICRSLSDENKALKAGGAVAAAAPVDPSALASIERISKLSEEIAKESAALGAKLSK